MDRLGKITELLEALAEICDTGFALAVRIRFATPLLLYQSYAPDWIDFYNENNLLMSDPVVRWGLENTGVIRWDDPGLDDPKGIIALAKERGLRNGVEIATGETGARTLAGCTRASGPFDAAEIAHLVSLVETVHAVTEGLDGCNTSEIQALRRLDPAAM